MKINQSSAIETLSKTVIDGGYCIGCGSCTAVQDSPVSIELNSQGQFQATINPKERQILDNENILSVCPFSDQSLDEDKIAKKLFAKEANYFDRIGYYVNTYAGYVVESDFRERGSSGGMAKWIQSELMRENLVDSVIHVQQNESTKPDELLYSYTVANSLDEIQQIGSKAAYYPVEMSDVLDYIKKNPKRYAVVGVPCFIKAIRLLSLHEPIFHDRVKFCIGIICGHLKSARYADMIAWQAGIKPGKLTSIDFRKKLPGAQANQKGVEVTGFDGKQNITKVDIVQKFFGTNYGHGFFKYQACDYCDDVVAETADIAVGDAWLPQYVKDGQGTSVVVVRHPVIQGLVQKGLDSGRLNLDYLTPKDVVKSQDAGLRHRREGLAYRLYLKDSAGLWRPSKRVSPKRFYFNWSFRKIHLLRLEMAVSSHKVFEKAIEKDSFLHFRDKMQIILDRYVNAYEATYWKGKLITRAKKFLANFKINDHK